MFLVYKNSNTVFAVNLNSFSSFAASDNFVINYDTSRKLITCDTHEEAVTRFNDIIEAATAGENVYDSRKDVGYWKAKKPGPKPKAKAPVQGNSESAK